METENHFDNNPEYRQLWECLTEKEKMFVEGYVMTQNAMEAARRAGYSEKSLRGSAYEILKKEKVQQVIFYRTNGTIKKFKLQDKEDATQFLVELIHSTYNEKKYTNCLNALEILASWSGWNSAKQIDINKKEIKVSFSDGNKSKGGNDFLKHTIKIQNPTDLSNPELES